MSRLHPFLLTLSFLGCVLLFPRSAPAQWATPTIDGQISPPNEYGLNNQLNNAGNTAQTWYMTWDASNLYVAITNANLSEGAVIYISAMPQFPPLSGSNANGSTQGFNYDGTDFSQLPFRANFVTYFKDGYREYRNSDGNNGWGSQTAFFGSYASNGNGNVRELAIPWSAITGGGLPPAFYFFGYLTSSGGYVYGQAPADNTPGAFIGTAATYTRYYSITNTGNGTSTPPFSNEQPSGFSQAAKAAWRHDTFDPFYRSAEGALTEGSQVTLRFRSGHFDLDGVTLRAYLFDTASGNTTGPVDTPMSFDQNITIDGTEYDAWKVTVTLPSSPAIYYYKFKPFKGGTVGWYSDDYLDDNDNLNKDGTGAPSDGEPFDAFQITVYDPNFQTPAWLQSANVYQIMPDRFRNSDPASDYCVPQSITGCPAFYGVSNLISYASWNSRMCDPRSSTSSCFNNFNQFYGGDLLGIQNELDYLQALGVDTLYLTPIFQARSYHRYDTDNYLHIDPALGGDAAFASLQKEMDRRGMRLILDAVFNHASSDGLYFDRYNRHGGSAPNIGACLSLQSMWRSWFHFLDNNVPCGSSDYVGWFGFDSLPTFDHTNPQVQQFFFSGSGNVMQNWYNQGASGWRFDVAPDPNFPHSWWVGTRTYAKSYKSDGPLIGEIWPNASQWLAGDQLDSTMNYRFRKNVLGFARNAEWHDDNNNGTNDVPSLTPSQFDHALRAVRDDYPAQATAATLDLIDSHDTNRALYVLTELGDTGLVQAKQRLELAALFQFTYVGAPMVMYGDEVAINSPSQSSSANGPIGDPYTRAPYPWMDQNGDPSIYGPPDTSVESFYTLLAHLRKQYPMLATGSFTTLLTGDTQQSATAANTYAFARSQGGVTATVALNNGGSTNTASIPVAAFYSDGTQLQDVFTGTTFAVSGGNVSVSLAARTGMVLLPYPASVDLAPPVASVTLTPSANANGWNNSVPVTANFSATDSGGSGVSELRYWVNNGPTNVAQSSTASLAFSGESRSSVFLRALDHAGNISALVSQPVNIDLTAPVASVSANPSTLWPPNGQSVPVTVSGAITDNLSGVDSSNVSFAVLDSDGTVQPSGPVTLGPGGVYSFTVLLQASRLGTDMNGRQYTITINAKDLAGNVASASTVVTVPHDQSN